MKTSKKMTALEEIKIAIDRNKPTEYDIISDDDNEGNFIVIEYNKSDSHVIWQSESFKTKEEAQAELNELEK